MPGEMINILFIAFEFPPLSRGGVHRPLAFVEYLPQSGIHPVVITLHKDSYPDVYDAYGYDEMLGKEVRERSSMIPVKSGKIPPTSAIGNFFSIYFTIHGNETKHWRNGFHEAVESAVKKYSPGAILATVPPFSILPLVTAAAAKYRLPLILDFRDAWSQWRTVPYGTVFHYWKTLQMERRYLRKADAIITTSEQTLNDFRRLHGVISPAKLHYVPNGYNGSLKTWTPIKTDKQEFLIGYVGSFYYSPQARQQMLQPWWRKRGHRMLQYIPHRQDWLYRSPYFFFRALQRLNQSDPELGRKIRVRFAGKIQDWLQEMIESFGLQNQVSQMGEISHQESLAFQEQCDALLITSARQIGGRDYSIAGKTFEYLQMQKPVIAFVCEGAQKDLLKKGGTSLICEPDNTEESAAQMSGLFKGETHLEPDFNFLRGLSRQTLTEKLAGIIRSQVKNT
jgi:glycosyltransferase involved in cell wall biosynthesis